MARSSFLHPLIFLFMFMLMVVTSYGDDPIHIDPVVIDTDILSNICNQTWIPDTKYCETRLSNSSASDVLDFFLHTTEVATMLAADIIAGLSDNTSSLVSPAEKLLLQKCQLDIDNALDGITAAIGNYSVYDNMMDDIISAITATKNCQDEIKGVNYFSGLGDQCGVISNLCELCLTAARAIAND